MTAVRLVTTINAKTGRSMLNGNDKFMNGNQTFKLAKKIYVFGMTYPSHKVKKFGSKFSVTGAEILSRSKFYKKYHGHSENVILYMIVKNGRVVAIGHSAGCID